MLNKAFEVLSSTVFVKWIGILRFLQYKDYKNILLMLCILYQCTFAANQHLNFSELHYSFPAGFYDYRLFYIFF